MGTYDGYWEIGEELERQRAREDLQQQMTKTAKDHYVACSKDGKQFFTGAEMSHSRSDAKKFETKDEANKALKKTFSWLSGHLEEQFDVIFVDVKDAQQKYLYYKSIVDAAQPK